MVGGFNYAGVPYTLIDALVVKEQKISISSPTTPSTPTTSTPRESATGSWW
jgi:hypothetical protein